MEQQPIKKSWWSRNWKWFVPVGCLSIVAIFAAVIALIVTLVFGAMKSSDVYKEAFSKASTNSEVISELGKPIEGGMFVSGSISVSGSSGEADLAIPISGPEKDATVFVVARKIAGVWTYQVMQVAVEGRARRIDLLDDPSMDLKPGSGSEEQK
jgi:hypothetical protein